jgi:acyl-CoA synthetase (NDP forming)
MAWDHGFEVAFHPRAVAVVGASGRSEARFHGGAFIRNLKNQGFSGRIYPVNPQASEVSGLKAYPSLAALPEPVDLVIISVPAPGVPQVLEECVAVGDKNIHIFTAGFSETGEPEGIELERRIKEIAQRGKLRVLGPNCMGLHVPAARFSTFYPEATKPGPVAFIAQSGGHCIQFTRYAHGFGIGFSKVVSYGNAALTDSTDLLEYFATDEETRIITTYIEGVKDGSKLLRQIKDINRSKPVIVWKGGLTASGSRAASSHTGSLTGSEVVWQAFFKQTGAVSVASLDDLADVTMTFLYLRPPPGRRVAVILGGGGHSVTTADFCSREGMEMPVLTDASRKALRAFVPVAGTSIKNPLEFEAAQRDLGVLRRMLEIVAADPMVDLLMVNPHLDMLKETGPDEIAKTGDFLCRFARENPQKPLVAVLETWGGDTAVMKAREGLRVKLAQAGSVVYRTMPRAFRALSKFIGYHEFLTASQNASQSTEGSAQIS